MPLQATSGAATYDAFGGGVAVVPNYIEDVFSTWIYDGNGSTQTIVNNIDLSTKGGLVWVKNRNNVYEHQLVDTIRGVNSQLNSASSAVPTTETNRFSSFNSNGFSLNGSDRTNNTGLTYASWTFRKQPKFFDIVTYTGNGTNGRAIPHSLGSEPGCIIVKSTSDAGTDWVVYHRSYAVPTNRVQYLNSTVAVQTGPYWPTAPTSTNFYVAGDGYDNNTTGQTYVAYLFAHNAGGFGLTGTDNVISCGSFTTDGGGSATVNLGYEPQWLLVKRTSAAQNWFLVDNMRGLTVDSSGVAQLNPNTSGAESLGLGLTPTSTGFNVGISASSDYIYIAIRRGPMKVPTVGTSVYNGIARTGTGANVSVTGVGFTPDFVRTFDRSGQNAPVVDRLRGNTYRLYTSATDAEAGPSSTIVTSFDMDGVSFGTYGQVNASATNYINHFFKRAPSFFDEVCYTGTGSATAITHNLGVVPELIICKSRSVAGQWPVYSVGLANTEYLNLEAVDAKSTGTTVWNSTTPTASVFSLGSSIRANQSGTTYVAYLFATCAGVSKVGSYTGNGTTQTINCGFTGGARFVLIKRTDSTGDWYTYDTARGMTTLTDPYLLLNSTAAEVATLGSVTTVSTGFALNSAILAAINVSSATYIFFAVA